MSIILNLLEMHTSICKQQSNLLALNSHHKINVYFNIYLFYISLLASVMQILINTLEASWQRNDHRQSLLKSLQKRSQNIYFPYNRHKCGVVQTQRNLLERYIHSWRNHRCDLCGSSWITLHETFLCTITWHSMRSQRLFAVLPRCCGVQSYCHNTAF